MKRTLIGFAISLSLLIALDARSTVTARSAPVIGQAVPDFTLTDLKGKKHSLKDYRGKIVALAFIGTQCPISNDYNARMRAISEDYAGKNVVFLGVNSNFNEPLSEVKKHAAKNNLGFTILKDNGNKVADAYGAQRTPEMFLVDSEGVLRYHGRIDNSREVRRVNRQDLRVALDELLAGKPVSVTDGKAFGCVIKRVQTAKEFKAGKIQAKNFEPKIGLLKPVDFDKFKNAEKGNVLVINFWATWCGPCVAEFPELVAIDSKYRDKGVKMVAISADEVADIKSKVIPFVKEQKAMFNILVQDTEDPEEMMAVVDKNWQGTLPATFVYDKQGNLAYTRYGVIDRDLLLEAIEKALK
ncbi:MAG: redoxin domain-containing protein [Acidobacteria bacterium]|nr:redoxin domain-containing protein [Acidobacteriota bacterium]